MFYSRFELAAPGTPTAALVPRTDSACPWEDTILMIRNVKQDKVNTIRYI